MFLEKLPDLTLATNERIRLQKNPLKSSKNPEKLTGKLAPQWPRITLEHLQESALRVNTYHQNARKRPGRSPDKPRSLREQALKNQNFIIFSTPHVKIVRSIISSISMLAALTVASPGLITYRCFRKNYQISASQRTNTSDCKKIRWNPQKVPKSCPGN